MKLTKFTTLCALGLVLTVAATGCKHRTPPVTKLPDGAGITGGPGFNLNREPGNAGALPGTTGTEGSGLSSSTLSSMTNGIPQGDGHPGWIDHRDILQGDIVHFPFDSSTVEPGEKSKVEAVAAYLKANAANAVKIEGHCDERGTEEYNRALGERRALALRENLVQLGIEPTRVDTLSFGKDRPANPAHNDDAWRENRRGEFIVLTPPAAP